MSKQEDQNAKIQRRTVLIRKQFTGGSDAVIEAKDTKTAMVPLSFEPDEVVVKSIAYIDDKTDTRLYNVYCQALGGFLGSAIDGVISTPELVVELKQKPEDLQFEIRELAGVSTQPSGQIAILLEFVRHARK